MTNNFFGIVRKNSQWIHKAIITNDLFGIVTKKLITQVGRYNPTPFFFKCTTRTSMYAENKLSKVNKQRNPINSRWDRSNLRRTNG